MANDKPGTLQNTGKALGSFLSSAGPVIVVLGIGGIGIYLIWNWLSGTTSAAIKATQQTIADTWDDYNAEYQAYSAKGNITDDEYKLLNTKLGIIVSSQKSLSGAVPDINSWVQEFVIGGFAAILTVYVLTHLGKIGQNISQLIQALKSKGNMWYPTLASGQQVPITFTTQEEMSQLFEFASICYIADQGNVTLASNLLQAALSQSRYTSSFITSMESSYSAIQNSLSGLVIGSGQYALAEFQLATYQVYFEIYPTLVSAPPLFTLPPPII
jgi:hypothetical protein